MTGARHLVVLLVAALLPAEFAAVVVSWETLGEVPQGFAALFVLSNAILVPLALWRPAFASALLVPWLLVVPVVGHSAYQHWRSQTEAGRIVAWAYEAHLRTGSFPEDLSAYAFEDPGIRSGIFRYQAAESHLHLAFGAPGQEGSAHWFDSDTGWGYYPD